MGSNKAVLADVAEMKAPSKIFSAINAQKMPFKLAPWLITGLRYLSGRHHCVSYIFPIVTF
jgi:hypothetical protein